MSIVVIVLHIAVVRHGKPSNDSWPGVQVSVLDHREREVIYWAGCEGGRVTRDLHGGSTVADEHVVEGELINITACFIQPCLLE
jgi:hypothetical protein